MTITATDLTLFDRIADLLPADLRENFYRRMAHLRQLGPNDDILQIAEAMGYLALVTREVPAEVATERLKLEALFEETVTALKLVHDSTLAHQRDLDRRLENLPAGIVLAFNPQNVVAFLSESLRQGFNETGLPAVADTIAANAQLLRGSTDEFIKAFDAFSSPECGALARLRQALISMQADLDNAANHVRVLTHALAKDVQRSLALFSLGALILGFFLGVQWAKQH